MLTEGKATSEQPRFAGPAGIRFADLVGKEEVLAWYAINSKRFICLR